MASYNTGQFIKLIRMRKNKSRECFSELFDSYASLSKIESGKHMPNEENLKTYLSGLDMNDLVNFSPYFEHQTFKMLSMRGQILDLLKCGKHKKAKELLEVLEKEEAFHTDVNLQFIQSCHVRVALLENRADEDLTHYITGALRLTYKEFSENDFTLHSLILQEPDLIHMLAETYRRLGQPDKTLRILSGLQYSLKRSPEDNCVKEEILPAIMLDRARILVEKGEFFNAASLCEEGVTVSLRWRNWKNVPDLLYEKAVCLKNSMESEKCAGLLKKAYASYTALGRRAKAEELIKNAKDLFRVDIIPIEMKLDYCGPYLSYINFKETVAGDVNCQSMGELLSILQEDAGISKAAVYTGICGNGHYTQIETGKVATNFFYLEALLQRLGRDINYYTDTFLSAEDFDFKQKKREIYALIAMKNVDEAERLLNELEENGKYKSALQLQFIANSKNTLEYIRFGKSTESGLAAVEKTLKITIPDFNEKKIRGYRLTYEEILLIDKLAMFVFELGDTDRAISIFERLKDCINMTYRHETEKARSYVLVLRNYAEALRRVGRYEESLEIIDEAERLCVKHQRLNLMPELSENRAYDLFLLGEAEASLPHFWLAYYVYLAIGDEESAANIKAYVNKENLDIGLDN